MVSRVGMGVLVGGQPLLHPKVLAGSYSVLISWISLLDLEQPNSAR